MILRKFSEWNDNIFTSSLLDIILPPGVYLDESKTDDQTVEMGSEQEVDVSKLTHVFLIL